MTTDPGRSGGDGATEDALAHGRVDGEHPVVACAHLNFQQSLAREGEELHRRVVDVFLDVAATRERMAAAWERSAALAVGPAAERCRALAARGRADVAATRVRTRQLMAHRAAPRPAGGAPRAAA